MIRNRKKKGAALLTVLVIGATSMAFLLALSAIVTSAVRTSAANKWAEALRNAAEIGIDYTVDKFNTVYPCPLDPPDAGTLVTTLPASELQTSQVNGVMPNSGIPNVEVKIKVTRLDSDQWLKLQGWCSVYSPQFDPNNSVGQSWNAPASTNLTMASGGGLRVVESTATNGIVTRTIRVVLKARFDTQPDGTCPLEACGATPITGTYFQRPLFGNSSVNFSNTGSEIVNAVGIPVADPNDSGNIKSTHKIIGSPDYEAYNLNVSTNRFASIGAGALVSGDVTVTSNSSGTNNVMTAPNGMIEGRALANGNVDSSIADAPTGGNVEARADAPTGPYNPGARLGLNNSDPVVKGASTAQLQLAPVATPSSATPLSDLSDYASAGTSPTANGSTTFETSSLSTAKVPSGKSVNFENGNSASPVRIFVDQGGADDLAVNIDTSKISTTIPTNYSNFQIWYEGNKPVTINMTSNFNGLIYAPNASVNIFGAGNFTGAVVGKNLTVVAKSGDLTLNIDTALGTSSGGGGGGASNSLSYKYRPGEGSVIQGWQPISWQEFGASQ